MAMTTRILIVDDDPAMLMALSAMVELRVQDIAMDTCESAPAALEFIGHTDYDAIVSDVKMPGMDGFQLMEQVLKIRPTTPTLLVTGHGDHDMGVKAMNAGAYAFIPKPIDRDFFIAWLKRAVQLRQLNRTVEQHTAELEQTVKDRTAQLERNNRQLQTVAELHRESEALYRSLAEAMPQIVYMIGPDGTANYVNDQWVDYTGVSKEDALKHEWTKVLHPEDKPAAVDRWIRAVREGCIFETECRLRRADGRYRWHLSRAVPFRDERGEIAKWIGTSTDIHDRKSTEEALRDSEERYKRLVKLSPDAILVNRDNRIVFVNEAGLKLFGATGREQVLGTSPFELFHADSHPLIMQQMDGLMGGAESAAIEARIIRLDGTIADVEVVASTFLDQGAPSIQVILRDITERKRSQERLRESEERLRLATKATNDAIWDWEIETDTVIWNDGVETLFGWTEAARESKTAAWWMERIHPDDRERIIEGFHAVVEQPYQNHWQDEYRFLKADGDYAHVFDRGYVMRNSHAAAYRVIGSMLDLTERRRAEQVEERLQKSEELLRRAQRAGKAGVWELDLCAGRIVGIAWSDAYYDLFALERTIEPSIDAWLDRIHPEDRPRISDEFRHAIENQCDQNMEFRIVHPDGSVRWMHRQGQVERDAQGQAVRLSGITFDITERRQAEDLVRDRERFLTTVTGAAHVGLVVVAPGYVYRFANDAYTEILRLSPHDILGRHVYEVIPDGWSQIQPRLDRAFAGERVSYELWLPTESLDRDPRYYDVTYEPHSDAHGERTVVVVVVDITTRKQAERALQDALGQYQSTFENAAVGMSHVGLDGRWLKVNDRLCEITGYTSQELLSGTFDDITHPDDLVADWSQARRLVAGEIDTYSMVKRYIHKQGRIVWITLTVSLVRDAAGHPHHFISIVEDITERKQADEALQASRERLKRALEFDEAVMANMGEGLYAVNRDGLVTYVNPAAEKLFGWRCDELLGRKMHDVVHYMHRDGTPFPADECTGLQVLLKGKALVAHEEVFIRKDGSFFDVVYSSSPIVSDGKVMGVVVVFRDVSEQKRAEEALGESEARFRTLADNMSQFAWMADATGWISWYNRRWYEYTGTTLEEMQGWGWEKVHHPDHLERVVTKWRRAHETGEPWEDTFPLRGTDGNYRWFLSRALPIRDANGQIIRWFGTNTDVTERLAAEASVRDKQEQLIQAAKLASIGELASGVAHELNNPLNNIGLMVGNVLHHVEHDPIDRLGMRKNLTATLQQVNKAAAIIGHLRTFARTASTPPETVDMQRVIRSAISLMEAQLRLHNVELVLDLASNEPVVRGNAIQLEQVFINLLTNARDAVEPVTDKRITIRSISCGTHIDVAVSDTGSGMSPEHQARVFDPFFTTKEIGKGTGLGLSISYGIIKDHGGTITMESKAGKGTTFVVRLPISQ
jgi:PAS domain S-box-containing protein